MTVDAISISTLNDLIEERLTTDSILKSVRVKGEITSITYYQNGNIYLDLSDGFATINAVVWNDTAARFTTLFKKGDEVTCLGGVRFYKKNGRVQFSIRTMEITGEGEASLAFEKLKQKLDKEGLFDQKYKKPIPKHPRVIGVVTSGSGAAVEDIVKTVKERTCLTDLIIFPVQVQGTGAAEDMVKTLEFINANMVGKLDLIIIGRGGGSPDDLAAFNDEALARAIFNVKIPIISAVGHEIDFSISDFVADARAATPTGAAQMAVPQDRELMRMAEDAARQIEAGLSNKLIYEDLLLERTKDQIVSSLDSFIAYQEAEIEKAVLRLKQGDVRSLLKDGYTLISDEAGRFIRSASEMAGGKNYRISFSDGYAIAETKEVVKGETDGK